MFSIRSNFKRLDFEQGGGSSIIWHRWIKLGIDDLEKAWFLVGLIGLKKEIVDVLFHHSITEIGFVLPIWHKGYECFIEQCCLT